MAMNQYVQERRPQREPTTIIPLTCYQVKTADVMQGDQYKANGRVLQQVTVVGIVRELKAEGNSVTITAQDAQGYECVIQKWGSDVCQEFSENADMSAEERKYMVRATGHVRSIQGKPGLMATRITLVQHFEEFMAHHLHASYCLQYHKHGPLSKPVRKEDPAKEASAATPTAGAISPGSEGNSPGSTGNDTADHPTPGTEEAKEAATPAQATSSVAPPQLTPIEPQPDKTAVRKAIMGFTANKDDGVHKDAIVQQVVSSVKAANNIFVRKEIEVMLEEGDLFTSKDAFHIAS